MMKVSPWKITRAVIFCLELQEEEQWASYNSHHLLTNYKRYFMWNVHALVHTN